MTASPVAEAARARANGGESGRDWALKLFSRSVLKQAKYRELERMLRSTAGLRCLDIGGDNGVISYLLRQRGGEWCSADLDQRTVDAIRQLVQGEVYQIDGLRTPFGDESFDRVVIVDYLEHIHTDKEFCRELARIIRPGGQLIVNVPNLKPRSLLNRVRHFIGLTDERHGHVRPGYDLRGLAATLGPDFEVEEVRTYSRSFSEAVDTLLNAAYLFRGPKQAAPSAKGTVVTGADVAGRRAELLMLSALYPFLTLFAWLDRLLVLQSGYKLIVRARRSRPRAAEAR